MHASNPNEKYVSTSYSEILPNQLYMGGMSAFAYMDIDNIEYDLWIQCSKEFTDSDTLPNVRRVNIPLDDDLVSGQEKKIEDAALRALAVIALGRRVLISCTEGRNRSGVVTARVLQLLGYKNPIELLREKRHYSVLTNPSFETYIRDYE